MRVFSETEARRRCMQVLQLPVQPGQVLQSPVVMFTPFHTQPTLPISPALTPAACDWSGSGHSKMVWGGIPAREASYHSLSDAVIEASNPSAPVPEMKLMDGGSVAGGAFFRDISGMRKSTSNDSIHSEGCAPGLSPPPPLSAATPSFAPLVLRN